MFFYNGVKDVYYCMFKEVNIGVSDRYLNLMCIVKFIEILENIFIVGYVLNRLWIVRCVCC